MLSIAIADDDAAVLESLRGRLEKAGHSVQAACNGTELLEFVRAQVPDLVITDIVMPEKEGIETILELRDRVARLRAENDALATELPDNARPSVPTVAPAPAPEPPETVDPPPAPEPEITAAPSKWVVIAGAERDLGSQRHELRRLQRGGFADALILKSGNWYQSSVIFPDRAAAEAGLREVSEIVGANRGAYIRAMDVYCPERTPVEGQPDVFACAG